MTAAPAAPVLVLASASPARRAVLRAAGIEARVMVSGVDESGHDHLAPADLALRLAELKLDAVAARDDLPDAAVVVACDSVLEIDGTAYGKPGDDATVRARWQAMRGRSGALHTGHALLDAATGRRVRRVASTTVHFADLDDAEIEAYVATGEPHHVAGAFTLDGYAGAFVRGIEGDPHNVVGISLPLMRDLLAELGHRWSDLWNR